MTDAVPTHRSEDYKVIIIVHATARGAVRTNAAVPLRSVSKMQHCVIGTVKGRINRNVEAH
jgi:hypothetical protein